MDRLRQKEIIEQCKDWQDYFPNMSIKDCFFALYDDRMITPKELDYLMDWITL